ncbi:MAG: Resolvase, N-terminal domain [Microbacterium sp.]|jgi:DNA invertase Pin-like site-specific DNA recombinase|nr:Resolvase, N-terminal domain [Microbacterium sp.]
MSGTTESGLTVAYLRVSVAGQSNGLESQLAAITKALGGDPDCVYSDEWSGRSMDRPGLTRTLDALRPGDTLVVYSVSRLGRSALDTLGTVQRLADSGVIVRSVTESIDTSTPAGRAFLAITLVIAQLERELIVERTQAGLAAARAKGRVGGAKKRLTPAAARSILRAYEAGERMPDIAEEHAISTRSAWRYLAQAKASRAKVQGAAA